MKHLAMLLPLALVAGCSGSSTPSGVAKSDYLKKAEVICTKANVDQKALKTPTTPDAIPAYVASVIKIADTATSGLAALEAPKADQKDLESKVLGPLRTQLSVGHDYYDQIVAATKNKDQKALVKLLGNPPTQAKADLRWMKGYGFKECVDAADTSN